MCRQINAEFYQFYHKWLCLSHPTKYTESILPKITMKFTWNGLDPCPTNVRFIQLFINGSFLSWIASIFTAPDLLTKMLRSIDETLFSDLVLFKQIRVLVEEWKKWAHFIQRYEHLLEIFSFLMHFLYFRSKVACLQTIYSNQDQAKLKKVLGVQAHDQILLNYWSSALLNQ